MPPGYTREPNWLSLRANTTTQFRCELGDKHVITGIRTELAHKTIRPAADLVDCAQRMAREHLRDPLPRRYAHTVAVAERVQHLAPLFLPPHRVDVLVAAAELHDIGYAPPLAHTGFHPIDGAAFVAGTELGTASGPSLVSLIAHHTGAVFEARERGLEEQLRAYPVPDAVELLILNCADVSTGPDGTPVEPSDRIDEVLVRYPSDHPVHRAVRRSGPLLVAEARLVRAAAEIASTTGCPVSEARGVLRRMGTYFGIPVDIQAGQQA